MKKNRRKGVVYSTDANFKYEIESEDNDIETLPNNEQNLHIFIDKHRAGKTVVIIKNFNGRKNDLKNLCTALKRRCGVGGSTKNGEIILQGDIRDKIIYLLKEDGYKYKKVGG